ncbi:MAG TPA: rod shape-determining protein MreD [Candidatus Kapabacteria bacterium]|nr:rod shape-determining protein MreD [Candidatus Kapabacteria bacterium]
MRMPQVLVYLGLAALLSLLQLLLVRYTSIGGVTPDLLLILVVWLAISNGQLSGVIGGFIIGLVMDGITGDVMGTNALSKTIVGFVAGYFFNENKVYLTLGNYPALLITLLCAVVHNFVYYFFHVHYTDTTFNVFVYKYCIASALYTTVFAIIPMLITARRREKVQY